MVDAKSVTSGGVGATGEAADGQTCRNFHGEVTVIFVVNAPLVVKSAKIGGDFSINMNTLANYYPRVHH